MRCAFYSRKSCRSRCSSIERPSRLLRSTSQPQDLRTTTRDFSHKAVVTDQGLQLPGDLGHPRHPHCGRGTWTAHMKVQDGLDQEAGVEAGVQPQVLNHWKTGNYKRCVTLSV